MLINSLIELTKCRIREFIREPSACFFVFAMPIIWILLLGGVFSKPRIKQIHLGIENKKHTNQILTTKIFKILDKAKYVHITRAHSSKLLSHLKSSKIDLVLDIKDNQLVYMYRPTDPSSHE